MHGHLREKVAIHALSNCFPLRLLCMSGILGYTWISLPVQKPGPLHRYLKLLEAHRWDPIIEPSQ